MSERDKMNETLAILSKEDPTFTYHEDAETGQLIISGMGELHLDVLVTRMKDDFKVNCKVGSPQVTYRESVTSSAEHTESFEKILGGKQVEAQVSVKVEQALRGEGNSYTCLVHNQEIPEEIYEAVRHAFTSSLDSGINWGYPCTDVKITVTDIVYNEETASTFAFEACCAQAFDKVCNLAKPELLEPVMNVDISCPKEFVGDAMSQMTSRGGIILGQDSKVSGEVIHAQAPMAKMFGFSTNLRSATQGRATFSLEFSHFQVKQGGLSGSF